VKALREKTGAGMMDCKAALEAALGDMEGAVRYLREKGLATAAKRAGRVAAEGAVVARLVSTSEGVMLELNCETDFVAKTPQFQALAERLVEPLAGASLDGVADAESAGFAAKKLSDGKTVADAIADGIASMGENVLVRRVARLAPGSGAGRVGSYVHAGGKIGVLVEAKTAAGREADEEIAALLKDVAMQVAAANPRYARREEVSAAELEKEREIYRGQAAGTGKPENVIEKIVQGKLEKFYADVCLIEQEFIRDTQLTVAKLVQSVGKKIGTPIEITRFVRMQLGESSGEA
jgi:elongation factor Ts